MGTETMIHMARKITPSPTVGIYLLKVNNRNTRTWCEICSELTTKMPKRGRPGVFIVNFEHISHLVLVFLLLTLKNLDDASSDRVKF